MMSAHLRLRRDSTGGKAVVYLDLLSIIPPSSSRLATGSKQSIDVFLVRTSKLWRKCKEQAVCFNAAKVR